MVALTAIMANDGCRELGKADGSGNYCILCEWVEGRKEVAIRMLLFVSIEIEM